MLGISKAKKATIVYNGIELEGYMLPDGSYHLSKTQIAGSIEKRHQSVVEFLQGKSPEAAPYKDFFENSFPEIGIEGNNGYFHGVPLDLAYNYWLYHANKSWKPAQDLITKLGEIPYQEGVAIFGENFKNNIHYCKKNKISVVKPEKDIQQQLNLKLNGLLEVATPVGKIDILTDKLLIEIKKAKDWKAAIGQLLMYGHYYPKHQKLLYLFGLPKSFDLELVSYLCSDFNIDVITNNNTIPYVEKETFQSMLNLAQ
jgi:hypothetical protein